MRKGKILNINFLQFTFSSLSIESNLVKWLFLSINKVLIKPLVKMVYFEKKKKEYLFLNIYIDDAVL